MARGGVWGGGSVPVGRGRGGRRPRRKPSGQGRRRCSSAAASAAGAGRAPPAARTRPAARAEGRAAVGESQSCQLGVGVPSAVRRLTAVASAPLEGGGPRRARRRFTRATRSGCGGSTRCLATCSGVGRMGRVGGCADKGLGERAVPMRTSRRSHPKRIRGSFWSSITPR